MKLSVLFDVVLACDSKRKLISIIRWNVENRSFGRDEWDFMHEIPLVFFPQLPLSASPASTTQLESLVILPAWRSRCVITLGGNLSRNIHAGAPRRTSPLVSKPFLKNCCEVQVY